MSPIASWTEENKRALVMSAKAGHIGDLSTGSGGFKKEGWVALVSDFNKTTGNEYDVGQVKNQFNTFRAKYKTLKAIKENSSFGWDPETQLPTASDEVWADYISEYPKAAEFRTQVLHHFDDLDVIFSDSRGSGSLGSPHIAMSSSQVTPVRPRLADNKGRVPPCTSAMDTPSFLTPSSHLSTLPPSSVASSSSVSIAHSNHRLLVAPKGSPSASTEPGKPQSLNKRKRDNIATSLAEVLVELSRCPSAISHARTQSEEVVMSQPTVLQQAIVSFEKSFQRELDPHTRCSFIKHLRDESAAEMYNAMLPETQRAYVMSVCQLDLSFF